MEDTYICAPCVAEVYNEYVKEMDEKQNWTSNIRKSYILGTVCAEGYSFPESFILYE
jgi:hypothetical protein